jgi:hypothetical protein
MARLNRDDVVQVRNWARTVARAARDFDVRLTRDTEFLPDPDDTAILRHITEIERDARNLILKIGVE